MEHILSQLESVRKTGNGFVAKCPVHDDRRPSLSIAQADDGRILLFCHAGCCTKDIVSALGMNLGDLFPDTIKAEQADKNREFKQRRKTDNDFAELRRRAFIAMVEFRDLTLELYDHYKLDAPEYVLKAYHMLPVLEWYLQILSTKTNDEQLELLREGILSKWANLFSSQN
jgi:DNA primase